MTLTAVQAALCVVLLAGAGLFLRSLQRVSAIDVGFQSDQVLLGTFGAGRGSGGRSAPLGDVEPLLARLRAIPGVRAAAVSDAAPFQLMKFPPFRVQGEEGSVAENVPTPAAYVVTPDYRQVLGIRLLRGRDLTDDDGPGAPRVMVVSRRMADAYWRDHNPIGHCVRIGPDDSAPCTTVVGITDDIVGMQRLDPYPRAQFYLPRAQAARVPRETSVLVRRTRDADASAVAGAVRAALQIDAPPLVFAEVAPLTASRDGELRPWRLGTTLFSVFGGLALAIAAVGLYGVLAFGVTQRRHEIGVRLALGATGGRIVGLVARQALGIAAAGIATGVALALAGAPVVRGLLYETSPSDPLVYGVVVATMLAAALVAGIVPAVRASRVAPVIAMRDDAR